MHGDRTTVHRSSTRPRVVVLDDRPVLAAAIASALDSDAWEVVETCHTCDGAAQATLRHRPDVLLVSRGLRAADCLGVVQLKAAVPTLVVAALSRGAEGPPGPLVTGVVDVQLGPEAGFGHLVEAIGRARRGERFALGDGRLAHPRWLPMEDLTRRERQVLLLVASGASNEEVATQLSISVNTVRSHVQQVLRKLGESRRLAAVQRAWRLGLLDRTA